MKINFQGSFYYKLERYLMELIQLSLHFNQKKYNKILISISQI